VGPLGPHRRYEPAQSMTKFAQIRRRRCFW
jgi:hypothetical protein